ncbi:MAG: ABC transporter ATP-binding protein [Spirochaetes bacterium]|nr:MAG: ABC transporter ATP-binding protein [Spirochaetota bacterium]
MAFIQLDGIGLSFGDRQIFKEAHLTISPGSRIALTGANGSGKSTLMKVAAGEQEYDAGRIISPRGTRSAYLPQSGIVHKGKTLKEEAMGAFNELAVLKDEADSITVLLENNEGSTESLLERYQEIHDTLENAEWDRREARVEQILKGLGFSRSELENDVSTFSGGWQMRIALSKILLTSPDVLLLDEPTNYLDLEAREWLRDFLKKFPGGVLLVSHDRLFLDETCNQVAELLITRLSIFKGTYSGYEAFREKDMADLIERWKRQQEEISKIETFITRFRYQATKAKQVQSRVKMLEKIERIEIPPALKRIQFSFPEAPHSGKMVLRGEQIERHYGNKIVFSGLDIEMPRGSRTAVVGVNGAGKTTLLRIISGEDSGFSGEIALGSGVKTGYFSQDQESVLDLSLTVLEEAGKESDLGEGRLRSLLGAFLFSGDDIHKKIAVLSGGERNRLALLKILLEPVNLLILDEPTNHLDIHSKDILLEALKGFGGTLVIVSHDRYFLEKIADRVLELEDGIGKTYLGDYAYYRWRKNESLKSGNSTGSHPGQRAQLETQTNPGNSKNREEQKKRRSLVNKLRREEESLTVRMEEKERKAAELRTALEQPENYSDPDKAYTLSAELMNVEERIEQISAAWEEAAADLENAENNL